MQDDRLALSITHANGSVTRWGGDEPDAGDVPSGLKFGTSIPGGFKDCTAALARRVDITYPDLALFDDARVYGPGDETVWEGRQQQFPRSHGSDFAIQFGAVGHSAHLDDDGSFREIYADRDTTRWTDMPLNRKAALAGSQILNGLVWSQAVGGWSLDFPVSAMPSVIIAELWYTAPGGVKIAKLQYKALSSGALTSWRQEFEAGDADSGAGNDSYAETIDGAIHQITLSTARRYIWQQTYANGATTTPSAGTSRSLPRLATYGTHGLTLRTTSSGEPDGVYASDAIADVVRRAAPNLSFTTGAGGTIAPTTFAIGHLVFYDPVTAASAIQLINGYHVFPWAVWEGKTFYFQPADPQTATVWEARLSEGAQIQLEGDQANDLFNGVIVTYTDPTGAQRSVGPPGSATDAQNSSLQSIDPANPAVAAGLRRWKLITLSVPTTDAGAIQLGAVWLAEFSLPQRRGQIVFNGRAHCIQSGSRGVPLGDGPGWRPRAGDYVVIADIEGDQPRQIIQTDYDHDQRRNTGSVGSTPFQLDAIVERLNSQLVGLL